MNRSLIGAALAVADCHHTRRRRGHRAARHGLVSCRRTYRRGEGQRGAMIQRQPGGPMTKLDPNGQYMVEQMYVQYFLPKNKKGKYPLLMWHGGGLTGVTYESTPDGRDGWLNYFVRKGWDVYNIRRRRARPFRLRQSTLVRRADLPDATAIPLSAGASAHGEGSWNADPAKRRVNPGSQYPGRGLRELHEAGACRAGFRPTRRSSRPISRWSTRFVPA